MIVVVQCTSRLKGPMKTWVTNLGCINFLLSSSISVRTFISTFSTKQTPLSNTTEAIIMSFGSFLAIQQLASQLSISIERLIAVCLPFQYRAKYGDGDRKLIAAAIWLLSAVFGAGIGSCSVLFQIPTLSSISTWVFFAGAMLTQVILYAFIIREVKATSRAVSRVGDGGGVKDSNACKRDELRRKQEKKLHILAIGITITYICCNLPITIFVGFYDFKMASQTCYTNEGLFYTISLAFVSMNLLIDPLWYFFYSYALKV